MGNHPWESGVGTQRATNNWIPAPLLHVCSPKKNSLHREGSFLQDVCVRVYVCCHQQVCWQARCIMQGSEFLNTLCWTDCHWHREFILPVKIIFSKIFHISYGIFSLFVANYYILLIWFWDETFAFKLHRHRVVNFVFCNAVMFLLHRNA